MIEDNKIEEAAYKFATSQTHGELLALIDGYKEGFKDAINEFLKDLWHPMEEEPKLVGEEIIIDEFLEGKRYPMVQKYMVGVEFPPTIETIRWISNWDSFLSEICDEVKMIRWCYFKDLLPKEGGEQ